MSLKKVLIPGVGEVVLAKRRGTTHLRLSITAKGVVRVSMPYWTPYTVGINFARERADWINKHLGTHVQSDFKSGDHIGKSHSLVVIIDPTLASVKSRLLARLIYVYSPYSLSDPRTQAKIVQAATRALKKEAEALLPQRLEVLAKQYGYKYSAVRIRSLTSRWGSCSSQKVITLSYFLMQLPWNLIDYVLLHELVHTKQMNHGPAFWNEFEKLLPNAKKLRRQVNVHKPRVMPTYVD